MRSSARALLICFGFVLAACLLSFSPALRSDAAGSSGIVKQWPRRAAVTDPES